MCHEKNEVMRLEIHELYAVEFEYRADYSLDMHILCAVQRINKWVMYHPKKKSCATNKSVVHGAEFEYEQFTR